MIMMILEWYENDMTDDNFNNNMPRIAHLVALSIQIALVWAYEDLQTEQLFCPKYLRST